MNVLTSKKQTLVTRLLIAFAVVMSLLVAPLGATPAYAKSLKASGVKFTKVGTVTKSKLWYAGAGKRNCTYSIKSVKVKNAKKAGYKTATVVFEVKEKENPTNRQIMAMTDHADDDGDVVDGWIWAFIVDAKTGENLEAESVAKKYGITMKTTGWVYKDWWRHTATDGSWVELPKISRIKYTVTYPKSYKRLCFGIGVGQKRYNDAAMRKFEKGKVTYTKCWWHKKNKAATHFVRVK